MKKKITILVVAALLATCVFMQACSKKGTTSSDEVVISSGDDSMQVSGNIKYEPPEDLTEITINGVNYRQKESVTNILLLGIDSDAERVKMKMGWRSDMIMLCSIDSETGEITLTSIPRDTYTTVYHINNDGEIASEVQEKLNHAYAYGGGPNSYSAENAMRCTEEFLSCGDQLHVPIDHYISIDLDGLPKLVEAMGGVTVTLDQKVPGVGSAGETVTLNGSTSRKFVQNRYDMDDGESSRQYHEQLFVQAMLEELKDMGKDDISDLYNTFVKFMRTDLTLNEVMEYANILDGDTMDKLTLKRMQQGDGRMEGATWYYFANEDEVIDMMLETQYTPV